MAHDITNSVEQLAEKCKEHYPAICDCGLADYREILALQQELHTQRLHGQIPDTVLIVEHLPVITLGARAGANRFLVSREEIERMGIDLVEVRRGGGVTAHNPGQLVFYPIVCLKECGLGVNEYIRRLESIGAELLLQLGVSASRREDFPGLWVTKHDSAETPGNIQRVTSDVRRVTRKIASIGVRVSKGITYHGMAINIQNDLSIFDLIVPCGLDGVEMTSVLKETGIRCQIDGVRESLKKLLKTNLS